MVKEIKQLIFWFAISMIAILFAMASVSVEGLMKYIYFFVSIASCYGIRLFAKGDKTNDGK